MAHFVIASHSTTDFDGRNPVEVYPTYLMPAHKRTGAWWSKLPHDAMEFATREAAQTERDRLFKGRDSAKVIEVPTYWMPEHFGANPETFIIEWYATFPGKEAILCGTREEARVKCRELNKVINEALCN